MEHVGCAYPVVAVRAIAVGDREADRLATLHGRIGSRSRAASPPRLHRRFHRCRTAAASLSVASLHVRRSKSAFIPTALRTRGASSGTSSPPSPSSTVTLSVVLDGGPSSSPSSKPSSVRFRTILSPPHEILISFTRGSASRRTLMAATPQREDRRPSGSSSSHPRRQRGCRASSLYLPWAAKRSCSRHSLPEPTVFPCPWASDLSTGAQSDRRTVRRRGLHDDRRLVD